jgi:hypothetical protein
MIFFDFINKKNKPNEYYIWQMLEILGRFYVTIEQSNLSHRIIKSKIKMRKIELCKIFFYEL